MKPNVSLFQKIVQDYYLNNKRDLPWRKTDDPYKILVSEMMLQQTQVNRVIPKYLEFLHSFPNIEALASTDLSQVITAWSGLGYNRRAKFLWQAARTLQSEYGSHIPQAITEIQKLPGIGQNTAGAIVAYAFDQPVLFVETNIRTVYIHHFFRARADISDKEILDTLEITIPDTGIREWYWALMDYGTYLKKTNSSNIAQSKHYKKQSSFEGSLRQIRGLVLKALIEKPVSFEELQLIVNDQRLEEVLATLCHEKLVIKKVGLFRLY